MCHCHCHCHCHCQGWGRLSILGFWVVWRLGVVCSFRLFRISGCWLFRSFGVRVLLGVFGRWVYARCCRSTHLNISDNPGVSVDHVLTDSVGHPSHDCSRSPLLSKKYRNRNHPSKTKNPDKPENKQVERNRGRRDACRDTSNRRKSKVFVADDHTRGPGNH